jgi:oxygen-independent coproporphyrinogen-3 oxidase
MVARQDDGLAAAQYQLAEELLADAGFRHYELSSWARPGFESRHNSAYWQRRPYTGIGAGAHSFDEQTRSWNERDLDGYTSRTRSGVRAVAGSEELDEPTRAFEAVALGLRQVDGFSRAAFAEEFGEDPVDRFAPAVDAGAAAGLLEVTLSVVRLTARGRLFANEALVAFAP